MRITNKMMTNNMLGNINKNKVNMSRLEQQYSTGKKIQRPSDDPIITVRALKLRTSLSELKQYTEKNIPDAMSWMNVTESALQTVNNILRQVNSYCVQGSTDSLTAKDRASIVQNLEEMKGQIYHEGNTNYAGRYVFTGYKTDTSLTFNEGTDHLEYDITEHKSSKDLQNVSKVVGGYELSDFETGEDFQEVPQLVNAYRVQLSYERLNDMAPTINLKNEDGETVSLESLGFTVETISSQDKEAYSPEENAVHFNADTGELVLGKNAYETLRKSDEFHITYQKSRFKEGELRPEHYFDCQVQNLDEPEKDPISYTKKMQSIQYEINYNQMITVNTEGSDVITHKIGRDIDYIQNSVNDVIVTENKIAEVKERLKDVSLTDEEKDRYHQMLDQFDTELKLKKEVMQKAFERGITSSNQEQDRVNESLADLGSRYVRLELTESRLLSQKIDFEELLSVNEDADLVDTVIKYNTAETIYNASLSAAGKVVQNTLLDFLR